VLNTSVAITFSSTTLSWRSSMTLPWASSKAGDGAINARDYSLAITPGHNVQPVDHTARRAAEAIRYFKWGPEKSRRTGDGAINARDYSSAATPVRGARLEMHMTVQAATISSSFAITSR